MARYIDADKLKGLMRLDQSGIKDKLKHEVLHPERKLECKAYIDAIEYCVEQINEAPTAEVEEVRHGKWIAVPSSDMSTGKAYKCSECGKFRFGVRLPPYCQECGARMDGDSDD